MAPLKPYGRRRFVFLLGLAALHCFAPCAAGAPSEYDLKAAFIFNFTQFVDWPNSAFSTREQPFVIGIMGQDPFDGAIEAIVRGEKVGTHPIQVRIVHEIAEAHQCHILFVAAGSEPLFAVANLKSSPILTVGETDTFARDQGMIRFVTERNRVRFRINLTAAQDAGLTLSSKLLRVAEMVKEEKR